MALDVAVRPARPQECAAVLDLWGRAGSVLGPTETLPELARLVAEHDGSLLVALHGGVLVGAAIVAWDGWIGSVYHLAVDPGHRRQGIARAVLAEAERRLEARGARRLAIVVDHADALALAFGDAQRLSGYARDRDRVRYVKELGPAAR